MSKSRLLMLVAIVPLSLVLANGVLAAVREYGAQLAPRSQDTRYKWLAPSSETVALDDDLQITAVVTPTMVYPGIIQDSPPAPKETPAVSPTMVYPGTRNVAPPPEVTPAAGPAFVYPDFSQDLSPVPEVTTPASPTRVYPGNSQDSPSVLAKADFESHNCNTLYNPIVNCSFETGDFTDWITKDIAEPLFALGVYPAGATPGYGFFTSQPTQGSLVLAHGFDGVGPDQISLAQDVTLPTDSGYLRFDYRLAWDLITYGATLNREFRVEVQPYGGGTALQTTVVFTAPAGTTNLDSGNLTGRVDVSGFGGQPVRIKFIWNVPEVHTGPAFFQLDNIDIVPIPHDCRLGSNPIVNCSFETGDFSGWIADDMTTPYFALGVYPAGVSIGFFTTQPTQGSRVLANGFDGAGPDQISLAQDVTLPTDSGYLRFDYRLAWIINPPPTLNREFRVEVQPPGGGPALQTTVVFTAPAGTTNLDSGNLTGRVDVSGFAGQSVRIKFIWNVPENFTGPAFFQLDNIDIVPIPHNCRLGSNPIVNCSFETGDFTGWIADDATTPLVPLGVYPAGVNNGYGSFSTQPTQGSRVLAHGFDAAGPDQISLAQDVSLPKDSGYLRFDYRLTWDMYNYVGSTLNREFRVEVQPYGGGTALQTTVVFTALAGTVNLDSGNLTGRVDVSGFGGQSVRIKFIWNVPENFTGPAFFQLDNIDIVPIPHNCRLGSNPIANCSFETGDFTGWIADDMAGPLFALGIYPAGATSGYGFFTTKPTQGSRVLAHGFDGDGPDQISLAQDVFLPKDSGYLRFDYRLAWDLRTYGATLNREFRVEVQPPGGGTALQQTVVFTAPAGTTNLDSGYLTGRVHVSRFAGQPVRIKFIWNVPESFTGPAFFQLDNIDIVYSPRLFLPVIVR